jgi:AraC-like DNA-binding protein
MGYREVAPSPQLRSLVAGVWAFSSSPHPHRVLPDGCVDVVVLRGRARVVGAMQQAIVVPASREAVVGARFRPGEAARLFPSLSELTDGEAALEDFWGDEGRRLEDALFAALDVRESDATTADALLERTRPIIEAAIVRRLAGHGQRVDPRTRAAAALLGEGVSVHHVATELGLSERQLSRSFSERVGLSPRIFGRVRRLQRATVLLQRGAPPGDAAASAGYADQPHFTRESRALAGVTPAMLAHEVRDGRDTSVPVAL